MGVLISPLLSKSGRGFISNFAVAIFDFDRCEETIHKGKFGEMARNPASLSKAEWWSFKSFLNKRSQDFHEKYYRGIEVFEESEIAVGFNYSWASFAKYVAANPGNHVHNHHWKVVVKSYSFK